jgi:hypothetical protein
MSEFKFACPVCGQHMMCDASQGGSVMECPTCFQKIIAPQAPASGDQKLILTGTKLSDKKIPGGPGAGRGAGPKIKFPFAPVIVLMLVLAAVVVLSVYRDKIFPPENPPAPQTNAVPPATPSSRPAPVAPHASDANWTLSPGTNAIPDSPVAGRIHGQDFLAGAVIFRNGSLTFRRDATGPFDFGVQINFGGAQPESLAGKTLNVPANADHAARVTLCWRDNVEIMKGIFTSGYALRLEFGALEQNRLSGKIRLCTPDTEKSYLQGSFQAVIVRPAPASSAP